ncbi:MAG: TlpA disulfide reductase family protein [Trueperaceae bacterium]|nr:TlpA disulfide reductase family protein [Trueperaceae bacterium]
MNLPRLLYWLFPRLTGPSRLHAHLARGPFILLLAVLLTAGVALAQQPGDPAPDFSLVDQNGNVVTLDDFRGAPLVLNMWATWCPPCREELPLFARVNDDLAAAGVPMSFLLVNSNESQNAAATFLAEQNIDLPAVFDATREQRQALAEDVRLDQTLDVLRRYRVRGMPTTFFIDADGIVRQVAVGMVTPQAMAQSLDSIGVVWQP